MTTEREPLTKRSRLLGCFLGGALGDALGAPIEFDRLQTIRSRYGANGITGFLPAYGGLGAITDDTQMTLFTAEGLLRAEARLEHKGNTAVPEMLAFSYYRWLLTQGEGAPDGPRIGTLESGWLITNDVLYAQRAPGITCLSALRSGRRGTPDTPLNDSKGCGAVMRVAPLGVVERDPFGVAVAAGALTHGHPSGYLSAGAFAAIINQLLHGATLIDAVAVAGASLIAHHDHEETLAAIDRAVEAAESEPATAERVETLGAGWVGEEALAIGLYCALVAPDVRTGLLLAVNHSGDSDSTGSIAGNLLGAMYGVGALPADLLEQLEARDIIETVANDLADVFVDGQPVDIDRYPPY